MKKKVGGGGGGWNGQFKIKITHLILKTNFQTDSNFENTVLASSVVWTCCCLITSESALLPLLLLLGNPVKIWDDDENKSDNSSDKLLKSWLVDKHLNPRESKTIFMTFFFLHLHALKKNNTINFI